MNTAQLFWIIPVSIGIGCIAGVRYALKRMPPICEDCPRVEQEDPIGEKYGTRKEGKK